MKQNKIELYTHQIRYWNDKYYHYSIHITDGGAIYLKQLDKNNGIELQIRLDGCDLNKLIHEIEIRPY